MKEEVNWAAAMKNRDRLLALGVTINAVRKIKGISQEQLAADACISRSYLSMIEAPNVAQTFSLPVLYNIADALGVQAGDLLNGQLFGPGQKQ